MLGRLFESSAIFNRNVDPEIGKLKLRQTTRLENNLCPFRLRENLKDSRVIKFAVTIRIS
jgi:hypothetical protein